MTSTFMTDDLTREDIVDRYRKRIAESKRARLTQIECEQLAYLLVETLIHLSDAGEDSENVIRSLCQEEVDLLKEGYPQESIDTSYIPTYTRLIQEAIASGQLKLTDLNSYEKASTSGDSSDKNTEWQHYALDFLVPDNYAKSPVKKPGRTEKQESQVPQDLIEVKAYLGKARDLLNSSTAEEIAIALSALTGRYYTELIQEQPFEKTEFPYLMRYRETSETASTIEINVITLIPVEEILPHLQRWQPMVSHLSKEKASESQKRAFIARVNHRIRKAFEFTQIIPVVEETKTVSMQWLRNAYGAIALYFFCPPTGQQQNFINLTLSHLLEPKTLDNPTIETVQQCFHYRPAQQGHPIRAVGIKLPAHGPVPLNRAELSSETQASQQDDQYIASDLSTSAHTAGQSKSIITTNPTTSSTEVEASHEWEAIVRTQIKTIADQAQAINWLTTEVRMLKEKAQHLTTAYDKANSQADNLPVIKEECQRLRAENQTLRLAQNKVDAFKALLLDHDTRKKPLARTKEQSRPVLDSLPSGSDSKLAEQPKPNNRTASQKGASHNSPVSSQSSPTIKSTSSSTSDRGSEQPEQVDSILPEGYQLQPTKASKAQQRAASIVIAIQAWNRQHPSRSFAITKGLLEHEFGINRKAATEFLEGNRQTLQDYYQKIGVNNERGHNRQPGRNIETLKSFVSNKVSQQSQ